MNWIWLVTHTTSGFPEIIEFEADGCGELMSVINGSMVDIYQIVSIVRTVRT